MLRHSGEKIRLIFVQYSVELTCYYATSERICDTTYRKEGQYGKGHSARPLLRSALTLGNDLPQEFRICQGIDGSCCLRRQAPRFADRRRPCIGRQNGECAKPHLGRSGAEIFLHQISSWRENDAFRSQRRKRYFS